MEILSCILAVFMIFHGWPICGIIALVLSLCLNRIRILAVLLSLFMMCHQWPFFGLLALILSLCLDDK